MLNINKASRKICNGICHKSQQLQLVEIRKMVSVDPAWNIFKAAVHRLAHVPCNSIQNKFVGPTLNSKLRTVEQSSSILRFSTSSATLTGLFLLLDY